MRSAKCLTIPPITHFTKQATQGKSVTETDLVATGLPLLNPQTPVDKKA